MKSKRGDDVKELFGDYDLLANSGLFDADFYLRANPDVAAANMDPLLHYIERGCHERLDPSADFDTAHYLKLCEAIGESPANALAHYLTVGIDRGLSPNADIRRARGRPTAPLPSARSVPPMSADPKLYVDLPRIVDGVAAAPGQGGLSVVGWAVAPGGVVKVDIAMDGTRIASARCQLRRPDVAAAHPELEDALMSGFAAHLPPKVLPVGRHAITVSLQGRQGHVARVEFQLDVHEHPPRPGFGSLRSKMSQAEVDLKREIVTGSRTQPLFRIYLTTDGTAKGISAARRTIASVCAQRYPEWEVRLLGAAGLATRLRDEAVDPSQRDRIRGGGSSGSRSRSAARVFVTLLRAGDSLGCDGLLEFAVASVLDREAEFIYTDELRWDPIAGKAGAFFKPGWSPDLLWSTNYVGRAWFADAALVDRCGLSPGQFAAVTDYDLNLRLTEAARRIKHIPRVLHQRAPAQADNARQERQALTAALRRGAVPAEIRPGCVRGYYRIKRALSPGRVSIIIPTCGANGHIQICLETLRARTRYRDYEIVCIENIPHHDQERKTWLRRHADVVIETDEPFNWSRYNNRAAAQATGRYLLFLNDDIEVIEAGWLDALVEQAGRPEVGVGGPLLLYPDRTVQQAGMMLDGQGRGRHSFRHLAEGDPGYFGLAHTQRNVIGVTGACLMTRRDTFDLLGGFDEAHAVVNNDLDFCLRAWSTGLINVYVPQSRLIHHELASRGHLDEACDIVKFRERWRSVIGMGDPYFNPNLSRNQEPFTVEREPIQVVYAGHPLFARSSVKRILVLKLDHIGDCITAVPAIRRLKHHFPEARLSVLAARGTHAIWHAERAVDEVIEFNFFHARSGAGKMEVTDTQLETLGQHLGAKRFDLAIDLRKQPDTRHILECTGAGILAGFDAAGRFPWLDVALEWDEDVPLRSKHGHVAFDLIALVDAVATRSGDHRSAPLRPGGALMLPAAVRRRLFSKPLICVHPAAGSPMRQWPPEKFAELIHLLLTHHRCNLVLIGGVDEREIAERVLTRAGHPGEIIDLVGRLALGELPKLLARSVLFIGNNSGPHHWAAGLGIATVGIHSGVVDAREWGPLGPRAVAVRRDMSCSPCFLEREADCPRQLACLHELSVADVYDACRVML